MSCRLGRPFTYASPVRCSRRTTQTPRHFLATVVVTIFVAIYVDVLLSSILAAQCLPLKHTYARHSLQRAAEDRAEWGRVGERHIQERSLTRTCAEMKINALEVHVVRTLTQIHRQPQHKLATNPQNSKPQSGRLYPPLPLPLPLLLPLPGPAQCDPVDLACVLLSS